MHYDLCLSKNRGTKAQTLEDTARHPHIPRKEPDSVHTSTRLREHQHMVKLSSVV